MRNLHYCVAPAANASPIGYGVITGVRLEEFDTHIRSIRDGILARIRRNAVATRARIQQYDAFFQDRGAVNPLSPQLDRALARGVAARPPLIEALLLAELASGILMGMQDDDRISGDLVYDRAKGSETFPGIRARVTCRAGEPVLRDDLAIIASLLQGPDARTRVSEQTRNVLVLAFAVPGIRDDELMAAMTLLREVMGPTTASDSFRIEHARGDSLHASGSIAASGSELES